MSVVTKARRKHRVSLYCFAVLSVFVLIIPSFLSSCTPPPAQVEGVDVRLSLEEYSWDELTILSKEVSSRSKEERQELLEYYHLVNEDGNLDGTQTKNVELNDGTKTQVRLIGFAHDDLSDKSGKAGFTFMFCEPIAQGRMNPTYTTEGGWRDCAMRAWLNNDFVAKLPEDLAHNIAAVDKLTNNEGRPTSDSPVTATSDSAWLLSVKEVAGFTPLSFRKKYLEPYYANVPEDEEEKSYHDWEISMYKEQLGQEFAILNEEGRQYSYFKELGVERGKENPELAMDYEGRYRDPRDLSESWPWWCRTPVVHDSRNCLFYTVGRGGTVGGDYLSTEVYGIVPCFCV